MYYCINLQILHVCFESIITFETRIHNILVNSSVDVISLPFPPVVVYMLLLVDLCLVLIRYKLLPVR